MVHIFLTLTTMPLCLMVSTTSCPCSSSESSLSLLICGLIPLVMAGGAGALGNRSIGTAAAGGMFIGTFVGIFLVPGLYLIVESWATRLNRNKATYDEDEE